MKRKLFILGVAAVVLNFLKFTDAAASFYHDLRNFIDKGNKSHRVFVYTKSVIDTKHAEFLYPIIGNCWGEEEENSWLDLCVNKGMPWALEAKFQQLIIASPVNPQENERNPATVFIQEQLKLKRHWAFEKAFQIRGQGLYGYRKSSKSAHKILKYSYCHAQLWAIKHIYYFFVRTSQLMKAQKLIERWANRDLDWAIQILYSSVK